MHTFKITDTTTNTLCAFLRCSYPHVLTPEEKASREAEQKARMQERESSGHDPMWPLGANLSVCDGKFGGLDEMRKKFVDDEEMYGMYNLLSFLSSLRKKRRKRRKRQTDRQQEPISEIPQCPNQRSTKNKNWDIQ